MSLKVSRNSSLHFMDAMISARLNGATLRLYSNNYTPLDTDADNGSSYTECTFPGYAAITLNTWAAAYLNASNKAETSEVTQTFTGGAIITPQNIYGIFVMDAAGKLVYAELNPGGVVSMAISGQTYGYLPRFTDKSEF